MAVAYETVALFKRLGANPTRVGLMNAARSVSDAKNPFLPPACPCRRASATTSRSNWPPAALDEGPPRSGRRALDVEAEPASRGGDRRSTAASSIRRGAWSSSDTEWFRTRWSDVVAQYGYDLRRIYVDGSPEDLTVFDRTHPDVVEHTSRTTAYEEQVCEG